MIDLKIVGGKGKATDGLNGCLIDLLANEHNLPLSLNALIELRSRIEDYVGYRITKATAYLGSSTEPKTKEPLYTLQSKVGSTWRNSTSPMAEDDCRRLLVFEQAHQREFSGSVRWRMVPQEQHIIVHDSISDEETEGAVLRD